MPVEAPSNPQWTSFEGLLGAIVTQLTRLAVVGEANLDMVRCDRRTHGDPSGPPVFVGACGCNADANPPTIAWEEEEFEGCCLTLGAATEELNVGPPDCFKFIDDAVVGDEQPGAPAGLTMIKTDPEAAPGFTTGECPPEGQVCIGGTPEVGAAALPNGTYPPEGVVYRFKIRATNCYGATEIACSVIVKRREPPC